jgi:simple sugar transport system substrate-binding protein
MRFGVGRLPGRLRPAAHFHAAMRRLSLWTKDRPCVSFVLFPVVSLRRPRPEVHTIRGRKEERVDAKKEEALQGGASAQDNPQLTRRRFMAAAGATGLGLALAGVESRTAHGARTRRSAKKPVYYWISHGDTGDQIWVIAQSGATRAAKDLGVTVRTSFHQTDVSSHKEAFNSAIAAGATGISSSSPQPGVLAKEIASAVSRGIPVFMFNTDDPGTKRIAYVGADLQSVGAQWANYLLSRKLVKKGDFVWMPVEVPGASYGVVETQGISRVFKPAGVKFEVFDAGGLDPAKEISAMTDYMTANAGKIKAIIGLGDLVTSNLQKVLQASGQAAGKIPAVGWGNTKATAQAVQSGWVNAATWQYPDSQGYQPIVLLNMVQNGLAAGYNIPTQALYDKKTVGRYIKYLK